MNLTLSRPVTRCQVDTFSPRVPFSGLGPECSSHSGCLGAYTVPGLRSDVPCGTDLPYQDMQDPGT
jgi:hypothetical protein